MTNSLKKIRLIELDILRILALFVVIFVHSKEYIGSNLILELFIDGARHIGLGLFVFLSGYSLQYSISGKKFKIISFLKKRILKIYPLYLFALFLYITLFHFFQIYHNWNFSPINKTIFSNIFSLQVIFSPIYRQVYTLWFIGMIVPLYFIFAVTAKASDAKFIKYHIYIFFLLIGIRTVFQIIDLRFLLYYPMFTIGTLYARKGLINKISNFVESQNNRFKASFYSLGLLIICLFVYFNRQNFGQILISLTDSHLDNTVLNYLIAFLYTILTINWLLITTFLFWNIFKIKFQSLANLIKYLSNISYAAYLLHRIVYAVAYFLIVNKFHLSSKIGIFLFPLVTIILFIVAGLVSNFEKSIVHGISQKTAIKSNL